MTGPTTWNNVRSGWQDSGSLRHRNRALVLELVRVRGPLSKAELARSVKLGLPAVTQITDELKDEGFIQEVGVGPSTGGRRPTLLGLVADAAYAIGLNIGTQTVSAVSTDLNGRVRKRVGSPSRMGSGPEMLMRQVRASLEEILEDCRGAEGRVLGVGMALPAPIVTYDGSAGMTFSPPSYPRWGELRIGAVVEEEFDLAVTLDNDANAAAIGEHLFGAGRGARDMFYLIAHRGVGGAVVVDGLLYRGAHGGAGEIGHTPVDIEGPRCGCGRYGCLEAFAGRAAIGRRASRALKLAGGTKLAGYEPDEVNAGVVIEAALAGDSVARRVIEETGEYLGLGIVGAVNALDPELVVMGGSTMAAGDLILEPATRVVRRRALSGVGDQVRIVAGELGEDAGAVGAASMVLRGLFSVPVGSDGAMGSGEANGDAELAKMD